MNITVYLGACDTDNNKLIDAAAELGKWIASSGHTLIYGGSKTGLMRILADSVLDGGGKVIGVEPQKFIDLGYQYERITSLIVSKDMAERKLKMIELGDAFIAFPGGTGTLEEISEVMSRVSMGELNSPCILYDLDGYYEPLKEQLQVMINNGLSNKERQRGIYFAQTLEEIRRLCR